MAAGRRDAILVYLSKDELRALRALKRKAGGITTASLVRELILSTAIRHRLVKPPPRFSVVTQ
jgi:hypothetical protein